MTSRAAEYRPVPAKLLVYKGRIFRLCEGVMEPKYESYFLEECLDRADRRLVLDLGTGVGFFAILLADRSAKVIATDINERAVSCARSNVSINELDGKVEVRCGDLFEPVEGLEFDMIVTNPPQMPTPRSRKRPWDPLSLADDGGIYGREIIDRIVSELHRFLAPGGKFQMIHFSIVGVEETVRALSQAGLEAQIDSKLRYPLGRLTSERRDYFDELGLAVSGPHHHFCHQAEMRSSEINYGNRLG